LSKPLGTGVITTAAKNGVAKPDVLAGAVKSMLRLNRVAARVARESGAKGATDITGFGFLGHAGEMVRASRAGLALDAARLPVLPGTRELAEAGQFSGGMKRNRRHVDATFGADLTIDASVPGYLASLLTESETSGGLLFSVAPDRAGTVLDAFKRLGEECWEIGSVLAEPVIRIRA
jgi:selenide,water dikinase